MVTDIRDLAVSTPDSGFQSESIRAMFTEDEYRATLDAVREKLIPRLDDEISNWRGNYSSNDDPESHVVVEDLRSEQAQEPDSDDFRAESDSSDKDDGERSVFEDVDE